MAKMTLREQFAQALEAKGEKQVPGRSSRYLVYTKSGGDFYYLGKAGSLRFGPNKTTSIPCSNKFKADLISMLSVLGT